MTWDISRAINAAHATISNGGKTVTTGGSISAGDRLIIPLGAAFDVTSGIVYWETVHTAVVGASGHGVGIADPDDLPTSASPANYLGSNKDSAGVYADGARYYNGTFLGGGTSYLANVTIRHLLDMGAGTYTTANDGGVFAATIAINNARTYSPSFHAAGTGEQVTIRATVAEFTYAVPGGATAVGSTVLVDPKLDTENVAGSGGPLIEVDATGLIVSTTSGNYGQIYGNSATQQSTGKWYWETKFVGIPANLSEDIGAGILDVANVPTNYLGGGTDSYAIYENGAIYDAGSSTNIGALSNNDIVGHLLDLDAGTYQIKINNGATVDVDLTLSSGKTWAPAWTVRGVGETGETAFLPADLTYAIPAGFATLSSSGAVVDPNLDGIVGAEGYVDAAALAAFDTDWSHILNPITISRPYLEIGGTKWFEMTSNGMTLSRNGTIAAQPGTNQSESEVSFAILFESTGVPSANQVIIQLGGFGGYTAWEMKMRTGGLGIDFTPSPGYGIPQIPAFTIADNSGLHYITVRHLGKTNTTNAEASFEVWDNGVLVASLYNFIGAPTDFVGQHALTIGGTNGYDVLYRNIIKKTKFTTALTTPPTLVKVTD